MGGFISFIYKRRSTFIRTRRRLTLTSRSLALAELCGCVSLLCSHGEGLRRGGPPQHKQAAACRSSSAAQSSFWPRGAHVWTLGMSVHWRSLALRWFPAHSPKTLVWNVWNSHRVTSYDSEPAELIPALFICPCRNKSIEQRFQSAYRNSATSGGENIQSLVLLKRNSQKHKRKRISSQKYQIFSFHTSSIHISSQKACLTVNWHPPRCCTVSLS